VKYNEHKIMKTQGTK